MQYIIVLVLLLCSALDSFAAAPARQMWFDYGRLTAPVKTFLQEHFHDLLRQDDEKYASAFYKRTDSGTIRLAANIMADFEKLSIEEQDDLFDWLEYTSNSKKGAVDVLFNAIPKNKPYRHLFGIGRWSNEYNLLNTALGGGYKWQSTLIADWNNLPLLKQIELLDQNSTHAGYNTAEMQNYRRLLQEYAALNDLALLSFRIIQHQIAKTAAADSKSAPKRLTDQQVIDKTRVLGGGRSFYEQIDHEARMAKDPAVSLFTLEAFRKIQAGYLQEDPNLYTCVIDEFLGFQPSQKREFMAQLLDKCSIAKQNAQELQDEIVSEQPKVIQALDEAAQSLFHKDWSQLTNCHEQVPAMSKAGFRSRFKSYHKAAFFLDEVLAAAYLIDILQCLLKDSPVLMQDKVALGKVNEVGFGKARCDHVRRLYISTKYPQPIISLTRPKRKLPPGYFWHQISGQKDMWWPKRGRPRKRAEQRKKNPLTQSWRNSDRTKDWSWLSRSYSAPRPVFTHLSSMLGINPSFPEPISELGRGLSAIKREILGFVNTYNHDLKSVDNVLTESDPFVALKRQIESFYDTYQIVAPRARAM
ncbi:MAG: hypothetical protein LBL30_00120 [Holosporales bacterium]|jgi:hypothetical protein|nr:hypothetical protein [Holosporales bacterium]